MITKDMSISQILQEHPETVNVFAKFNLGCIGCWASRYETLEQGILAHGADLDVVLKELNDSIEKK
ncbi:MAG: DUF1858 domain-containing protein [Candidatus Coatesbacteria bacterium]|nr:DUF1858 domain-containing protein [Candidatus Coatesbacteria bacterium]